MNSGTIVITTSFIAIIWFLGVIVVMQMKVKRIAESTHVIVNSQRTMLLRVVADLTRQLADLNPTSQKARDAADVAQRDAEASEHPRRESI